MIIGLYLLIGMVLNYGSIFLMYGILNKITKDHLRTSYLINKYGQLSWDFVKGYTGLPRALLIQILWPLNVYNTIWIYIHAIKEAREEDKDE